MAMLSKIGRLFIIKTRFEAWLVIYAIAVGSMERGQHYMTQYPGFGGYLLALACTGVVFVAGAKLLDSTPKKAKALAGVPISGSPPTGLRWRSGSESRPWHRTDSRQATRPSAHRAASPEDRTHNLDR